MFGGIHGGSMYGGGLGIGSSMYGAGLGSMGGMYGGGMYGNSGLMGGSAHGMSGVLNSYARNNQYGSSSIYSLGNNGDGTQNNGMQSSLSLQQQQTERFNPLISPINQHSAPLPPLNESPEERSRRIQAEHKKERQLIRQQRDQHRQARLQARMEIAGHLTNVLVQGLRSAMELFGVCFGTYYSMRAVRAFSNSQERIPGMGMYMGANYPCSAAVAKTQAAATSALGAQQISTAPSGGPRKWRTWLLCIAFFILGEVVYGIATRQRTKPLQHRRRIARSAKSVYGGVISQDEYEVSIHSSDTESRLTEEDRGEAEMLSEAWGQACNSDSVYRTSQAVRPSGSNGARRVYYALYDYQAQQTDGPCLSFKAGDEFVVEDYAEGSWCEAMAVESGNYSPHGRRGLVPSNFLRLAERITKL
ncbi:peroxin_13 (plasmid) [Leishmania braziliensis MHOM/BR/75/M2904]|nr:peroxin_13 [Leishmania braziliensis MHOM/BR/75/M2904]